MKILIDLREPTQDDLGDGNDLNGISEQHEAYIFHEKQTLAGIPSDHETTPGEKATRSTTRFDQSPTPSRTPIYDSFMLAAGKTLGFEEDILRGPSPRRTFGRNVRLLKNFVSEAEELQRDIDSARNLLEHEEAFAAIEYCRLLQQPNDLLGEGIVEEKTEDLLEDDKFRRDRRR